MSKQSPKLGITLLFVAAAFVALFLLASAGTIWAAPPGQCGTVNCPQPPPTKHGPGSCSDCAVPSVTPVPSTTCTLSADGSICTLNPKSITVPAGAVPAGTMLTLTGPLSQPPCPATSSGAIFLGDCFKVDWKASNGTPLAPLTAFAKPVTDCLLYTGNQVAMAGGDPANLRIGFIYDPNTLAWTLVKPTVDTANSRVCTNVSQVFFYQGLFTPAPGLPITGGAESSPMWGWLVALGAFGLASVWGGKRLLRQ
jgi:hypothetical protein